jgi:hypothetical protein
MVSKEESITVAWLNSLPPDSTVEWFDIGIEDSRLDYYATSWLDVYVHVDNETMRIAFTISDDKDEGDDIEEIYLPKDDLERDAWTAAAVAEALKKRTFDLVGRNDVTFKCITYAEFLGRSPDKNSDEDSDNSGDDSASDNDSDDSASDDDSDYSLY